MKSVIDQLFTKIGTSKNTASWNITRELLRRVENDQELPDMKTLSQICFVSPSMITKFSKSLGYDGYKEMVVKLKIELNRRNYNNFEPIVSDEKTIFSNMEENFINAIKVLRSYEPQIVKLANAIKSAKKIYIFQSYSFTKQALLLQDVLVAQGYNVVCTNTLNYSLKTKEFLTKDDYCIFLIGGVENNIIYYIYSEFEMHEIDTKYCIFVTNSKVDVFSSSENSIVIDTPFLSHQIETRISLLDYLFLQLFSHLNIIINDQEDVN